jgi:hypothetical protein
MARANDLFSKEESRCLLSTEESRGPVLYGREQATAVPVGLGERHSGCLRGGRGEGLFFSFFTCGSLAVWWRRRCEVGIRKPGHRLSRPPLFVLPNSSSNQPSNFALRILVGEMSPRGIADLLIYNENGNRPQRIRGQSQCHSGLRTLALRSLFSCASLCTHRIRERRL